jgi:hypothetical protein
MTKMSSTMLSVGTLLRRAEETGSEVRVLVQGCWLDGRVIGCDGLGAILDDGNDQQVLVRLESVVAVTFSRAHLDGERADDVRPQGYRDREPIEAGPVRVPSPASGDFAFIPAGRR